MTTIKEGNTGQGEIAPQKAAAGLLRFALSHSENVVLGKRECQGQRVRSKQNLNASIVKQIHQIF
jgi:hypothetical protein